MGKPGCLLCAVCKREYRNIKDPWGGKCPQCAKAIDTNKGIREEIVFHKSLWATVPASTQKVYRRWSNSALNCLTLNRNCSKCHIGQMLGMDYPGRCKMPESVQALLDENIMPKKGDIT